ncbi:AraC family transcriptional regulator [Myroides sp. WP-1]|uniref:helix-turn-helix domain-containing protein n=1 Tax=Myroides sp. WP-1 TaxID=2759944 RepID=UPI0015F84007|nr:helix-turn-helix domain-containing protein [Myroides sp. WP-1]MBB1138992.1 AraC family transcriptional regulator [Myroides sp. WP-1]
MKNEDIIKEIQTLDDFKSLYFTDQDGHSSCEECCTLAHQNGAGFLEVFTLEYLAQLPAFGEGKQTRKQFYTLVLITEGQVEETIGYTKYIFTAGNMYFVGENQLHHIQQWSEGVKGFMCLFDADYFLLCLKHQIKLNSFPFFQFGQSPFIELSEREVVMMEHLFWKLNSEKCHKQTFNDDLLVRMFLNIILLEAERIYNHKRVETPFVLSRKEQLVARFQLLVNQKIQTVKQVNEYAAALHVHPHYLNDVVKEITGNSASYFIHKQLVDEIKSRLIQTSDTVAMIAGDLNFSEESYLGRFFKKQVGLTPIQYRKKHKQH